MMTINKSQASHDIINISRRFQINTTAIIRNIEMIDQAFSDLIIMSLNDMIEHTTKREIINLVNFSHNMRTNQTRTHLILFSYHSYQNLH